MIERISTEECTNYDLRITHEYENYVNYEKYKKYENNLKDVLSFCFIACGGFALGDIAEFVLAELAADGRDTVGEDMCLKMVVLMKHNPRGKVRQRLGMLLKISVLILDSDSTRAHHIL